jgi:hypothetical protein
MLKLYYLVWVDCMARELSQSPVKNQKPKRSMVVMSTAMTFNLALFMTLLQKYILGFSFYKLDVDFLPKYWENVISFLILFPLPCVIINYLLIYYKGRYEKLLAKYPSYDGKLFISYFLISLLVPIALLWVVVFL